MFIDTLVNISISQASAPVSAESLSVPLLISDTDPGWTNSDVVRTYGTVDEMVADGVSATSNLAVFASRLLGGSPKPSYFLVGKKANSGTAGVGEKIKIDFSHVGDQNAEAVLTMNGVAKDVDGDQYAMPQNMAAAFQSDSSVNLTITYTSGNTYFEAEAKPGQSIDATDADTNYYRITIERQATAATQGSLSATDLDAFVAANPAFYAVIPVAASDSDIKVLADWVEGVDKLAWVASASDNNSDQTSNDSVAGYVKSKAYRNTAVVYSPLSAAKGITAAWAGAIIPQTPGTANPAYQTLPGIVADTLSTGTLLATVGNLVEATPGNRANVYISQYSSGVTLAGTTGASTIYEVMGVHWLKFNMRAAVFSVLKGQKKALTDKGVQTFIAAVRGVLAKAVTNGLVDPAPGTDAEGNDLPGISVTAPSVGTLTAAQRAGGVCPPITFTCTLSGPINAVRITGVLQN